MIVAFGGDVLIKEDNYLRREVYNKLDIDFDDIDDYYYINEFKKKNKKYNDSYEMIHFDEYEDGLIGNYKNPYEYSGETDELEDVDKYVYSTDDPNLIINCFSIKFTYHVLNRKADIYKCDKCGSYFFDYNKNYRKAKKKRKNDEKDICINCWEELKRKIISIHQMKMAKLLKRYKGIPASRPQRYLAKILNGEINYKIEKYYADVLLDQNIVIEFDGSGHMIKVDKLSVTLEEFNRKESFRDQEFIRLGYKILRLKSKNDLLPNDEAIFELVNHIKKSDLNLIEIDINKLYNKNQLRKINEDEVVNI